MCTPGPEGGKKATPSAPPLHLAWSTLGPTDQLPPRVSQPSRWCEAGNGSSQRQHRHSSDCALGMLCSKSPALSLASLHLVSIYPASWLLSLLLPSTLLLSPLLALFNHYSLFLVFSQPLQVFGKEREGPEQR